MALPLKIKNGACLDLYSIGKVDQLNITFITIHNKLDFDHLREMARIQPMKRDSRDRLGGAFLM